MSKAFDKKRVEAAVKELLSAIGEDPTREGLLETPARVARFYEEFTRNSEAPDRLGTSFEAMRVDQMVVVSGMRVWSLCEHHMLPFWADITVAYIPDKKILGLSKFGRIAHMHASSLQVQERLIQSIAEDMTKFLETENVAVMAKGEHLCMTMRGVKTPAIMKSSVLKGKFKEDPTVRQEFLALI